MLFKLIVKIKYLFSEFFKYINNSTFKLVTNEIKEKSGKDVVDCRFNKNNNKIKVNIIKKHLN